MRTRAAAAAMARRFPPAGHEGTRFSAYKICRTRRISAQAKAMVRPLRGIEACRVADSTDFPHNDPAVYFSIARTAGGGVTQNKAAPTTVPAHANVPTLSLPENQVA